MHIYKQEVHHLWLLFLPSVSKPPASLTQQTMIIVILPHVQREGLAFSGFVLLGDDSKFPKTPISILEKKTCIF